MIVATSRAEDGGSILGHLVFLMQVSSLAAFFVAEKPLLRRWTLAHFQLHEHVHRCLELRRRFDEGAPSVSLSELSIEVAHQCRRSLDAHEAIRGQIGCVSLGV